MKKWEREKKKRLRNTIRCFLSLSIEFDLVDYFSGGSRDKGVPRFWFRKQPSRSGYASGLPSQRIQSSRKCLVFPTGCHGTRWIAPDHFLRPIAFIVPLRRSTNFDVVPRLYDRLPLPSPSLSLSHLFYFYFASFRWKFCQIYSVNSNTIDGQHKSSAQSFRSRFRILFHRFHPNARKLRG